jgi:hypothetical protein
MTGDQTSHITVTYRHFSHEVTRIFAVTEDTLRDAQLWAAQDKESAGEEFRMWLESKGCQLDSSDGPASVWCFADGSTYEAHWRNGQRNRQDGPASVWHDANGTTVEKYFRDGKLHREDGPAIVWRGADGTTNEEYYRDGELMKEEQFAPLSIVSGVTVQRPAPKAPNTPHASGPA